MQNCIPRPEHPRPDYMRDTYASLNGTWQFAFDDENIGLSQRWQTPGYSLGSEILVPFCYQSEASGIGGDEIHPVIWYRRPFFVSDEMQEKRILLRFGAVDYACRVYVNGEMVGTHIGGYTPFAIDITDALAPGENDLCLRVEDSQDRTQPRGKQYWQRGLMGCWYTPTSGIWQSVYLEAVDGLALDRIHVTPDLDAALAHVDITLEQIAPVTAQVELTLSFSGRCEKKYLFPFEGRQDRFVLDMRTDDTINAIRAWSPQEPNLYDLSVRLIVDGKSNDHVRTYFGMRKIEVKDGVVYLNGHRLYQRLVLDQGYWPQSLLTPPSDDAIREDVEWTLKLGYNGARKHQKVEDPRYYYWADKLGMLVWGEVPSPYMYDNDMVRNVAGTLQDFIERDYNHPSIVTWVPLNESWGVPQITNSNTQQAFARALYHLCKACDPTRLVSSNDGWEQVTTDICALHDYAGDGETIARHFADRDEVERNGCDLRLCYALREKPTGKEAFMVTEYGGIAMTTVGVQGEMGGMETWGYNGKVEGEKEFLRRFADTTNAVRAIPYCQGYCYTQLTDVQQEINGLLTPDRKPKVDPKAFEKLNRNP